MKHSNVFARRKITYLNPQTPQAQLNRTQTRGWRSRRTRCHLACRRPPSRRGSATPATSRSSTTAPRNIPLLLLRRPASSGGGDGNPSVDAGDRDGSRSGNLNGLCSSFLGFVRTLVSLLILNPFVKLSPADLSAPTPSWTLEFIGTGSYSWPVGPSQARMRVQENVRRYARNYASLWFLILACSLYKMPIALLGLMSSLLLWELERFCSTKWELEEKHPGFRQALVRIFQLAGCFFVTSTCVGLKCTVMCQASAVVLYFCNLQLVVICATGVSYAVMLFHASLRKLTPWKQSTGTNKQRSFQQKRLLFAT